MYRRRLCVPICTKWGCDLELMLGRYLGDLILYFESTGVVFLCMAVFGTSTQDAKEEVNRNLIKIIGQLSSQEMYQEMLWSASSLKSSTGTLSSYGNAKQVTWKLWRCYITQFLALRPDEKRTGMVFIYQWFWLN